MRVALLLCSLTLFSLAGCVVSTQPLYTPETLKKDLDLAGTWECRSVDEREFDARHPTTFKALGNGEFEVHWLDVAPGVANPPLIERTAALRVVELNGFCYLDISGVEFPEGSSSAGVPKNDQPISKDDHLIYAVRVIGSELVLARIDPDRLRKHAAKANLHFGRVGDSVGYTLKLDAPTDELQKFVIGHREVFDACTVLRRIEKRPAGD